ncbi:hypothetical protein F2P81_022519 [Scophthalmus maximus]|uniref:Peptidase A2 domain-containing protein n=1 Tax=Scophthalmus maximus TaxID=52904 RepID=A0A6A4S0H4_SCOMX|nr:hypothetical protein F2P81_022519 [Scophthalmus maximus]
MPKRRKNSKEDKGSDEPHKGLLMSCVHKSQLYATDEIQRGLDSESKSHTDSVSQDQLLLKNLKAKEDALSQMMAEEFQVGREKTKILQEELDKVRTSYEEDIQRYEADMLTVRQLAVDLQHNFEKLQNLTNVSPDPKPMHNELSGHSPTGQKASTRERVQHIQELNKSQRWEKPKDPAPIATSYEEDIQRYEADMLRVRQLAVDLQHHFEKLQILTNASPDPKPIQDEVSEEIPMKQRERVQHFHELNKPQIWEKPKYPASRSTSYQEDSQSFGADRLPIRQQVDNLPSMMCQPCGFSTSPATAGQLTSNVQDVPDKSSFTRSSPCLEMVVNGVKIPFVLDTGAKVTLLSHSLFLKSFSDIQMRDTTEIPWLKIRGGNGLRFPFKGYLELDFQAGDIEIMGKGVLIVKDDYFGTQYGLLGTNVISEIWKSVASFDNLESELDKLQDALTDPKPKTGRFSTSLATAGRLSGDVKDVPDKSSFVGPYTMVEMVVNGVKILFKLDTGSRVTLLSYSLFQNSFKDIQMRDKTKIPWLKIKAANGLEVPYQGYVVLDFQNGGFEIIGKAVLIVQDEDCCSTQHGVLGMNVIAEILKPVSTLEKLLSDLDKLQYLTDISPDPKPMETEVQEEIHKKPQALTWNRIRHFQGLKKPQRWRKPNDPWQQNN